MTRVHRENCPGVTSDSSFCFNLLISLLLFWEKPTEMQRAFIWPQEGGGDRFFIFKSLVLGPFTLSSPHPKKKMWDRVLSAAKTNIQYVSFTQHCCASEIHLKPVSRMVLKGVKVTRKQEPEECVEESCCQRKAPSPLASDTTTWPHGLVFCAISLCLPSFSTANVQLAVLAKE